MRWAGDTPSWCTLGNSTSRISRILPLAHLKVQNVGETADAAPDCACPWIQRVGRFLSGNQPLGADRDQFLATMDAELIANLNVTAILTEKSASECLEIVPGIARAPAGGQQGLGEVSDGYRHEWGWLNEDRCCQQVTF